MLQLGGATLCALWAFGVTFVVFKIVNATKSIRVSRAVEVAGLDEPEYGLLAYPEDAVVSMEAEA
jgi:Amt family ammonium transporter